MREQKRYTDPVDAVGGCVWGIIDMACKAGVKAWLKHMGHNNNPKQILERFFLNKGMVIERGGKAVEKPRIAKINKTPYGYHIILGLYPGISLYSFKKHEVEAALNAEVDAWVDPSGWMHMRVYTRHLPKIYPYRNDLAQRITEYACAIPIGISRRGFVMLDLSTDENFALLLGGQPGFGKSEFLRQALTAVILNYKPSDVQLYLVDMKNGVEFEIFQNAPHVVDWAGDASGAARVLRKAAEELKIRAEKMRFKRVTSIKDYNKAVPVEQKMPHVIVVIDEYASLEAAEKAVAQDLCQRGRFAGIHPIICTQRPSHTILPGDTKALMPVGLCFKAKNKLNSTMILGDENIQAAYLRDKGRAIFQATNRLHEVQVMALDSGRAARLMHAKYTQMAEVKTYQLHKEIAAHW
jgi:hypothetical protein